MAGALTVGFADHGALKCETVYSNPADLTPKICHDPVCISYALYGIVKLILYEGIIASVWQTAFISIDDIKSASISIYGSGYVPRVRQLNGSLN